MEFYSKDRQSSGSDILSRSGHMIYRFLYKNHLL